MPTNWSSPQVIVAVVAASVAGYAAVISTINLIWSIIRSISENRRRIIVKTTFYNTFSEHLILGISSISPEIHITLINSKKISCTIKQPIVEFNKKVNTSLGKVKEFALARKDDRFPITLEYGKIVQFAYSEAEVNAVFKDLASIKHMKARFIVYDSFGGKHKTKYYRKEILNCIKLAQEGNKITKET